jgi:diguanylate cyclase
MAELDNDDWRRKYYDSIRLLEQDERMYSDQIFTLKRLITRLCVAGQGASPLMDEQLQKLKDAIGQEPLQPASLELIGATIADVVKELDHTAALLTSAVATAPTRAAETTVLDTEQIADVLSRLLLELHRDPDLIASVEAVKAELTRSVDADSLPALLGRISTLAATRIRNLEKVRSGLEALLEQMVSRLDEMSQYMVGEDTSQQQQSASRDAFSTQLTGEVQALGASLDTSTDFLQVRTQLRARLDSIGKHLLENRQREADYARDAHERNEKMRTRIEQLESEAHKLQQRLVEEKRVAMLDPLTQVPNRLAWNQRIAEEMERWQRFGQPTCLATWDVDRFKSINDTYGHTAGDKVLKVVAETLAKHIRSLDFVARYGGEEFVMLLPGTPLEHGVTLVNELREAIAKLGFHFQGKRVVITISCGITALREGDTATHAFERADKAMYQAKETGRNKVVSD